jgi:C1A family cysteine protease
VTSCSNSRKAAAALPSSVDHRAELPPVFDQGDLGSCTANATCAQYWHLALKKDQASAFLPSRLFHYYVTRAVEGTVNQDAGAHIRDSIKAGVKWGLCHEELWPYVIGNFKKKLPDPAKNDAAKHKILQYHRIDQSPAQLKSALADGRTVNFGFTVYTSFESDAVAKTGIMPMPNTRKERAVGGHAVLAVGYDDEKRWYVVRNSWGESWGDKGYFYMPYDFIHDHHYADDFWVIDVV